MLCRRCGSALTYISGCIVRSVRPAAFRRQASDNHSGAMLEIGQPQLQISSAFDSGNIEIAGDAASLDPSDVQLRIRPDPYCKSDEQAHYQWFHFQVTGEHSIAGSPSENAWRGWYCRMVNAWPRAARASASLPPMQVVRACAMRSDRRVCELAH